MFAELRYDVQAEARTLVAGGIKGFKNVIEYVAIDTGSPVLAPSSKAGVGVVGGDGVEDENGHSRDNHVG